MVAVKAEGSDAQERDQEQYKEAFGSRLMRDVMELLREKEQELLKVKRQVEALRYAAPLLVEEDDQAEASGKPVALKGTGKLGQF